MNNSRMMEYIAQEPPKVLPKTKKPRPFKVSHSKVGSSKKYEESEHSLATIPS